MNNRILAQELKNRINACTALLNIVEEGTDVVHGPNSETINRHAATTSSTKPNGGRHMSMATRRKISLAAKHTWAAKKVQTATGKKGRVAAN